MHLNHAVSGNGQFVRLSEQNGILELNYNLTVNNITITTTVEISHSKVADLIITAVEGGSNYWCKAIKVGTQPTSTEVNMNGSEGKPHRIYDCIFNGGTLVFVPDDYDEPCLQLNLNTAQNALEILNKKFNDVFTNITSDNYDASDADAFIQCAIFGDVIFC